MPKKFSKNGADVRHFRLVARSQNDNDPDATPLVLEPFAPPNAVRRSGLTQQELTEVPESLANVADAIADPDAVPERIEYDEGESIDEEDIDEDMLDGDCYFPRDGYNYEQHLKKVSGTSKGGGGVVGVVLEAPEPVKMEEIVRQPAENDDEAELLRAMDFDEEYDELAEDDLDVLLPSGVLNSEEVLWGPSAKEQEERGIPDLAAFKAAHKAMLAGVGLDKTFRDGDDDEVCSVATYPQESVNHRLGNGKKDKIDEEAFDAFFMAEYGDDDDIGACDEEDIQGNIDLERDETLLDEYIQDKQEEHDKMISLMEPQRGRLDDVPRVIEETKAIIAKHYLNGEDEEETDSGEESPDESKDWDCESVLSTLSNLSNRPGKIGKIDVIKKPVPMKSLKEGDEKEEESDSEDSVVELPDVITERPKNESKEDKKARKAAVKEMRAICRKMKKESKVTYKAEAAKLPGQVGNGDIREKMRRIKIQ